MTRHGDVNSYASVRTVTQVGVVSVSGSRDQRIAALAGFQHGRVARWQLLGIGLGAAAIDSRLRNGRLWPVHRGVYAVGHTGEIDLALETSALLAMPAQALLSHFTAAHLLGIRESPGHRPVDVLVPGAGGRRRPGIREHRTERSDRLERHFERGLPLTSPAQTVLDIAPLLGGRDLERALDEALARRLTTLEEISRVASLDPRRPGSASVRELCRARSSATLTRSQSEELFLELVREAGLPEPEVNVKLHGFEVDFLWREAGLVVEADGYQWHSSKSAFERDRRKDAVLTDHGLEVMRLTWSQIRRDRLSTAVRVSRRLGRLEGTFTGS